MIQDIIKIKQQVNFDEINIICYDQLKLMNMGENDTHGYQIFTPRFIVEDMVKIISVDIVDFTKNILEPTSGDGAFTTHILKLRLEKALEYDNFELASLQALSTIYSIEMDKELLEHQRNNIYTIICRFIQDNNINVSKQYFELVKCIISTNFMWAMFNSQNETLGLWVEVAYKMPEAEKGNFISLDMPVWIINNKGISLHYEEVEL